MDLDVLFPFHRVDKNFEEAIQSLANTQSVKFNLIAIDDRYDKSVDVSHVFKPIKNFAIVQTKGSTGYGEALRVGTQEIRSPHVALFNSDDLVHPSRFAKQLAQLQNNEISITNMKRITSTGRKSFFSTGSMTSNFYDPIVLLLGSYGANATWCMHRNWWIKNAFFDDKNCLDWRIALKTFRESKIGYINEPLYIYRRHSLQFTTGILNNPSADLTPVYKLWKEFSINYFTSNKSREIFDIFATPWRIGQSLSPIEASAWRQQIQEAALNLDKNLQFDIQKIIKRRFLFASRNPKNSSYSKIKYLSMGLKETLPLLHDLILK
jgi:glycosyltransferase involved in cell wall biosynthesis